MSAFALRLAILPSILLLLFVVGKNKQRRNPTSLLVWLAVLGAVSAIPMALRWCYTAYILHSLRVNGHKISVAFFFIAIFWSVWYALSVL